MSAAAQLWAPSGPYYERDGVVIHLGDCRDVLPGLGRDSVDLIVTDPPYGVGFVSGFRGESWGPIAGDDDASWVPSALALACRSALRRGRHAYVFGPESLLPDELAGRATLIWDKQMIGPGDLASPWGPSYEPITFAAYEPSPANRRKGYGKGAARLRQGSVLRFTRQSGGGAQRHPTEKPVPLLRRLVESSSLVGETVLDPFAGSGSTLVAAVAEGRRGVGVEVDERYAEIAAGRVDRALDAVRDTAGAFT